jgi:FkbM family methyltransferase
MLSSLELDPNHARLGVEASPADQPFLIIAHHPHWRSSILLDPKARRVRHMMNNSTGRYTIEGAELRIDWDRFPTDHFRLQDGIYMHRATDPVNRTRVVASPEVVHVAIPASQFVAQLRSTGSDIAVFQQVFINREYATPCLPDTANVIIDLGANIGLASLFFAEKYRKARIIAIEPDPANLALLARNLAQISSRAAMLPIAIWSDDCELDMTRTDVRGNPLGDWGVQVGHSVQGSSGTVRGCTMRRVIDNFNLKQVDIVKIDIEGAEKELFQSTDLQWLDIVNMIIVETHERFRPGSHDAVLRLLELGFVRQPDSGENCVFTRSTIINERQ